MIGASPEMEMRDAFSPVLKQSLSDKLAQRIKAIRANQPLPRIAARVLGGKR